MLQPAAVLAVFTLAVLLLLPIRRIKAAIDRKVTPEDFRYGESARVPPEVILPNRNLMNLLELPVLFYLACLMIFVMGQGDAVFLWLAWGYVVLRILHSAIHLTYNKVMHRMLAFAASNFVLGIIWVRLLLVLW
jgi:hypothetical protein